MKKFVMSLALLAISGLSFAQKQVTIKGGTIVPVEAVKNVRATEVRVGQNVDFQVVRDVIVDGIIAIPTGTIVKGSVYEAKRSTAFGTKGRLGIRLKYLNLPSGDVVNFASSDVYIQGKNRTALSIIVFCCTYLPFPCGSRAELKTGVEYDATVANNTTVTVQ
jgi:hypothetical protein